MPIAHRIVGAPFHIIATGSVAGTGSVYSSVSGYGYETTGTAASSTGSAYAPASSDAYSDAGARIDVAVLYASIFYAFLAELPVLPGKRPTSIVGTCF
jgi:hypothetical protein